MNISGTLHFYSGEDRELFFVFDDDAAQLLYDNPAFDIDNLDTRRAYVSVGSQRFIHRRTLSFSRKQSEIKISLCSRATKDGLGSLTTLYDWYGARGRPHPAPFAVIGTLSQVPHQGEVVWELRITEPAGMIVPPGLDRRTKQAPPERRTFAHRRQIIEQDFAGIGRVAEEMALSLARDDFPTPDYQCLWRRQYLDSERIEIRKMGVIADIDVWNMAGDTPELFIEVKAQKVRVRDTEPAFHLSASEWHSHGIAAKARVPYQVWLFQYRELQHFTEAPNQIELIIFDDVSKDWLKPDNYIVTPEPTAGDRYPILAT